MEKPRQILKLERDGKLIKVSSVMNAGFAGYQVAGYVVGEDRNWRIGHY